MARAASSSTIVGREPELDRLADVLAAAERGEPRLVLLGGEAGVGKTRLLRELEDRAERTGALVLHGECVEFGGEELPYAPIVAALRDLPEGPAQAALAELSVQARAELAGLVPALASAGGTAPAHESGSLGQGRLYEVLLTLLRRLARECGPVLLAFEDLHWGDQSSRSFLAFFARNARTERVALIATYRTDELDPAHPFCAVLAELRRRERTEVLELARLSRDAVARQLELLSGGPVGPELADALHARTGGNPFFVEELLAAHRHGGLPSSVAEAIAVRVDRLPPASQALVGLVAAAGGRLDATPLERAFAPDSTSPAVRAALAAHVLERDGEVFALRHSLVGEVVLGRLLPSERRALHGRIAHALDADADAPVAQLALHWHRAGEHAAALAASLAAGEAAVRVHASAEARTHLDRALELWDAGHRAEGLDPVTLLAGVAEAARFTGDYARASACCRRALALVDARAEPRRAARLHERLAAYHFFDDATALVCLRAALGLLPDAPSSDRARIRSAEGQALLRMRRWSEAQDCGERALADALATGAIAEEGSARTVLGMALAFRGRADGGAAHLERALAIARAQGAGETLGHALVHLAESHRLRGGHEDALRVMREGQAEMARYGMEGSFGRFMRVNAADDCLRLGRFDEAQALLEQCRRAPLGPNGALLFHALAGQLAALRGDAAAARAELDAAQPDDRTQVEFIPAVAGGWTLLALLDGRPEDARERVRSALGAVGEHRDALYTPLLHTLGLRAEATLAERARGARDEAALRRALGRAEALVADLDEVLRPYGDGAPPDALAHRCLAHAELARARGRHDPGAWAAAADAWAGLGERGAESYARLRCAETALLAGGRRAEAQAALRVARAWAAAERARPLLEEIDGLARRARLALDEAAPEPAPAAPLGLSPRELEVLALLAGGRTNREIAAALFMSHRTASTHVTHILQKLNAHSRVEAAGIAHRLGILDLSGRSG